MRAPLTVLAALFYAMCGVPKLVSAVTIAADDAGQPAYANGWQAGDNGGTGFGPWVFDFSGVSSGLVHEPQFIDVGALSGNSLGAPAFGLTTSDRPTLSDTSEARRTFVAPIAVGDTFGVDVDGSALTASATPFSIGNTIELIGGSGQERFGLFTNNQYHDDNWTATGDVDTGIPGGSAFHIDFVVKTPDTYDLIISPIGGGSPLFMQSGAALEGSGPISRLRVSTYGTGSSSNGSKELFFNNLTITRADGELDGDYNADGAVDAADYVVWRKQLGTTYTQNHFNLWRAHFGQSASSTAAPPSTQPRSIALPEPSTFVLSVTAVFVVFVASLRGHAMDSFIDETAN